MIICDSTFRKRERQSGWFCQGTFDGPAAAEPRGQRVRPQIELVGPVFHAPGFPLPRHPKCIAAGTLVTSLFGAIRPAAILRCVRAIVIDAVNRVALRWPWPHVSQEIRKRLAPTVTDCDAATAISVEAIMVRIGATLDHVHPRAIFRRESVLGVTMAFKHNRNCNSSLM